MTDSTALLQGLEEYMTALDRHLVRLREQKASLDRAWGSLNDVYHGSGAAIFRQMFERAREMIATYNSSGEAILTVMRQRVESLRRFDASGAASI